LDELEAHAQILVLLGGNRELSAGHRTGRTKRLDVVGGSADALRGQVQVVGFGWGAGDILDGLG